MKANLLLLEDDESLGETLSKRLTKDGFNVSWNLNLTTAREFLKDSIPGIAVLDIGLPDGSGFELGKELKERGVPLVYLTAMNSPEFRLEAFELGADDYIPKPFHYKELLLRISRILQKPQTLPEQVSLQGLSIDCLSLEVNYSGQPLDLTPREVQVLALLIHKSPQIVSRKEILELWEAPSNANTRTIDNAVLRIRQVLGVHIKKTPIESVRGKGYKWIRD